MKYCNAQNPFKLIDKWKLDFRNLTGHTKQLGRMRKGWWDRLMISSRDVGLVRPRTLQRLESRLHVMGHFLLLLFPLSSVQRWIIKMTLNPYYVAAVMPAFPLSSVQRWIIKMTLNPSYVAAVMPAPVFIFLYSLPVIGAFSDHVVGSSFGHNAKPILLHTVVHNTPD